MPTAPNDMMAPFTKRVDLASGAIPDAHRVQTRRLSDLRGLFGDADAEEAALAGDDPLVYRVYDAHDAPKVEGQLLFSTTVIEPGRVGAEFFMTKGHYHAKPDRTELYYGLKGEGYLLLQTRDGRVDAQRMTPGTAAYVPPHWGHRTVNTGAEPFVFLAVFPADAGYDYGSIREHGFASRIVGGGDGPRIVPNPTFQRA